ncbi:MAG: hypothetical protein QXR71_04260 [Candidatus Aenigmatarchaeota archaeon]
MITIIKTIVLLLISLSFAFAQLQSHPLSEIKPIDVNLDMFLKNIINVSYVGINTSYPLYPLHVIGNVYWSGTLQGGNVPWERLINFPAGCPEGYAVRIIGSSLTCIQINATQGVVNGSGTANYIPIWSSSSSLGNSIIYQSGGSVGIGTTAPSEKLDVNGNIKLSSASPYLNLNGVAIKKVGSNIVISDVI